MKSSYLTYFPFILGLLLLTAFVSSQTDVYDQGPKIGDKAPIFKSKTLDNQNFDLNSLKGKLILLDFWFTTCPPCQQELPHLKKVYKEYKNQGFEIVSIDGVEEKETIQTFVKNNNLNWIQLFDPQGEIHQKYSVQAFPTPFLIGPDGIILAKGMSLRMNQLEQTIQKHINKISN